MITKTTTSSQSLYIEIAAKIREDISRGKYSTSDKMPSEAALASIYNVSRNTIREALSVLENEGLLIRKHGSGTFLKGNKLSVGYGKARTIGFTETKNKLGQVPGTRSLVFDWEPADASISKTLGISVGSLLGVLKRLRTVNGKPLLYAIDKLPEKVIGSDFTSEKIQESLFEFLQRSRGVQFDKSEIKISATVPNRIIAEMLGMDPSLPLLLVEEIYYNFSKEPILWSQNYYRSDIYSFSFSSDSN